MDTKIQVKSKNADVMDEILYSTINRYYDTLIKTGYIPIGTVNKLIILDFISELTEDPSFSFFATDCDNCIISKLYECVTNNNCLI